MVCSLLPLPDWESCLHRIVPDLVVSIAESQPALSASDRQPAFDRESGISPPLSAFDRKSAPPLSPSIVPPSCRPRSSRCWESVLLDWLGSAVVTWIGKLLPPPACSVGPAPPRSSARPAPARIARSPLSQRWPPAPGLASCPDRPLLPRSLVLQLRQDSGHRCCCCLSVR
jgi:hypothetical protein